MSADQQRTPEALSVEVQAELAVKHAFLTNTDFQVVTACEISGPDHFTCVHPVATLALEKLQKHFDALSPSDENLAQKENVRGCLLMILDSQDMIDYPERKTD